MTNIHFISLYRALEDCVDELEVYQAGNLHDEATNSVVDNARNLLTDGLKYMMKPGCNIKVALPDESPWAIVESICDDGSVTARIDNILACFDRHGYDYGDVLTFKRREFDVWEVAK